MDLVRDCLDEQLRDQNKRPMGRVDGIILEFETGRKPRVAYVEVGLATRADRISIRLRRLLDRILKMNRYRIPWSKVTIGLNEVTVAVKAESTPALVAEAWLRKNVIGHIPGAGDGKV